ncbi:hypothetical protein N7509_013672 [Penicillium cosmopolitanum]|uniref:Uncharacterized protein n=1 Tax=Penicillium cosmopolitanum TaxID=1131564 RepID=A0A9W9SDS6_9EURO|nr:uncharacterized protein N7509_013672 [Penicillium cosmopolitanum]KAJ5376786.1 hypothetical protein N7509_013672 [Penicillium cosmopolitanum]
MDSNLDGKSNYCRWTRRGSAVLPITRVRSGGLQIGLKGRTDQFYCQYDRLDVMPGRNPWFDM